MRSPEISSDGWIELLRAAGNALESPRDIWLGFANIPTRRPDLAAYQFVCA
jgi:hypothetical protein